MAKRGQFYPFRIKYAYASMGTRGSIVLMNTDDVAREAKGLLRRGADIEILRVDPVSRDRWTICKMTPADLPDDAMEDA